MSRSTRAYFIIWEYGRPYHWVLDLFRRTPLLCSHWKWKPTRGKFCRRNLIVDVVANSAAEYEWTLERLAERELYPKGAGGGE